MSLTLEYVFTKHAGIKASPLQLAICRAADARPLNGVLVAEALVAHFGIDAETALEVAPRLVVAVCGVRGGKTFLAVSALVKSALTADMSKLHTNEPARAVLVGPHEIATAHSFGILRGIFHGSSQLARLIISESKDSITIKRPDGRIVEFVAVAAHRSGVTLRGAWLVGFVLEEAASFGIEGAGATVNAEELLRAAEPRLLPGGQGWIISSPRGPEGLLHDLYQKHFGKPGRVLVVHAPSLAMNPSLDAAEIEALRAEDADTASREFDATWLDAATSFLDAKSLNKATRKTPVVLDPGACRHWISVIDPATRGNSFALLIVGVDIEKGANRYRIGLAKQWTGSKVFPLQMGSVLSQVRALVAPYRLGTKRAPIRTDQWSADVLVELGARMGLAFCPTNINAANKLGAWDNIRGLLNDERLELAPVPELLSDMRGVRRIVTPTRVSVEYPVGAGRHGDYAAALATLFASPPDAIAYLRQQQKWDQLKDWVP